MKSMEKVRPRQPDSSRLREIKRGKMGQAKEDVVHFEASVIEKFRGTEARAQAIVKKAATKDIGKAVLAPTAEAKLGMTIDPIIETIVEVMGDREQAMRWLGTPVRALDFATPISMMATPSGKKRVLDVVGQMEHGVW
jgi:putative toxin-antitoxin system antitoxin component (TIGR02293 family)